MTKDSPPRMLLLRGAIVIALLLAISAGIRRGVVNDENTAGAVTGAASGVTSVVVGSETIRSPPVLVVWRREPRAEAGASAPVASSYFTAPEIFRAAALDAMLMSLDEAGRRALNAAVMETNTRLEARANPLAEDLEGGDPEIAMREWSRGHASMLRAAAEFARASWCASDGLCVAVLETCRFPSSSVVARCIATWGPSTDPDATRARFMAWPFASSAVLHVEDPATVAALRSDSRLERSSIALVITGRDHADLERSGGLDLRKKVVRWQVLSAVVRDEERRREDAAGVATSDADGGEGREHLRFAEQDVVVIPKLASITKPDDLMKAIARIAPHARVVAFPSTNGR